MQSAVGVSRSVCKLTTPTASQVQGVFFRAGTIEEAKKLGVVGHVENTSSGTVTGEVQGEPKPVSQMKVSLLQCNSGLLQRRSSEESLCDRTGCNTKGHLEQELISALLQMKGVILTS